MNIFQAVYDGKIDTWAYQWMYTVLARNGLSILSNINLVSNIGFRIESTHTRDKNSIFSSIEVKDVKNIEHPNFISIDQEADSLTFKEISNSNFFDKMKNKILKAIDSVYFKVSEKH